MEVSGFLNVVPDYTRILNSKSSESNKTFLLLKNSLHIFSLIFKFQKDKLDEFFLLVKLLMLVQWLLKCFFLHKILELLDLSETKNELVFVSNYSKSLNKTKWIKLINISIHKLNWGSLDYSVLIKYYKCLKHDNYENMYY